VPRDVPQILLSHVHGWHACSACPACAASHLGLATCSVALAMSLWQECGAARSFVLFQIERLGQCVLRPRPHYGVHHNQARLHHCCKLQLVITHKQQKRKACSSLCSWIHPWHLLYTSGLVVLHFQTLSKAPCRTRTTPASTMQPLTEAIRTPPANSRSVPHKPANHRSGCVECKENADQCIVSRKTAAILQGVGGFNAGASAERLHTVQQDQQTQLRSLTAVR